MKTIGSIVGYVLHGEHEGSILTRPAIVVEPGDDELSLVVFTGAARRGCFPVKPVKHDPEASRLGTWHELPSETAAAPSAPAAPSEPAAPSGEAPIPVG